MNESRDSVSPDPSVEPAARVLVLTPVRDAVDCLDRYATLLDRLTYPRHLTSLALLEGDSRDGTWPALQALRDRLLSGRRRLELHQRHFGFHRPAGLPRWAPAIQIPRRAAISKARNHLLFRALDDEDWVLWIDVDVIDYPPDVIERLLAVGQDIVHPHCVVVDGRGKRTFDLNAWRDRGAKTMPDLVAEGEVVRLDAVGGTMLLVKADRHRDGLVFPPFLYGDRSPFARERNPFLPAGRIGELDTEGFGVMARDMGFQPWGLPHLEIRHRPS